MLLHEHNDLWNNIREFSLNEPGAVITFSQKLKDQQKWTASYTDRVIEEYKKFIFLCCISPKGASPSKAVDEAWHLHLTYTKSYWIDFCKNTLNKDIHHYPSKGGNAEDHKHEEWYRETLELYKKVFGVDAPPDIWPMGVQQGQVIQEPDFVYDTNLVFSMLGIMLTPFVFIYFAYGEFIPYLLTGPEFLIFYPVFVFALLGVYVLVQWRKRNFYYQLVKRHFTNDANIFQQASFLYGKHTAVQSAIVDLLRRDLLEIREDKKFVVHTRRYSQPAAEVNPLIRSFLKAADHEVVSYEEIAANWYEESKFVHPALGPLHQFVEKKETFWENGIYSTITAIIGILRLIQGMVNDRPVVFLVFEMVLLLVMQVMFRNLFNRSKTVLNFAERVFTERANTSQLHPDYLVQQFAAKGVNSLAGISNAYLLAAVFASYPPVAQRPREASSDNSTVSSCGSNGGASSCGGDGGAGCGGCGGGGGD